MLQLTKRQTTDKFVEICLREVPSKKPGLVSQAIEKILNLARMPLQDKAARLMPVFELKSSTHLVPFSFS